MVPPSVHFIGWGGTLDRYLLPLLPFSVLLLLWALRGQRLVLPLAWLAVVVLGGWSVAGTRDHLVWLSSVWSLADGQEQVFEGHTLNVNGVAFTPKGSTAVSVGYDGELRIWPLGGGAPDVIALACFILGATRQRVNQ